MPNEQVYFTIYSAFIGVGVLVFFLTRFVRPFGKFRPVLPLRSSEDVITAAGARRAFLRSALDFPFPELDDFLPSIEVRETPPVLTAVAPRRLENTERFAFQAILRWQWADDELMLLARVVDAISVFAEQNDLQPYEVASAIYLLKARGVGRLFLRLRHKCPSIIVIETSARVQMRNFVFSVEQWLGISIAMRPSRRLIYFSGCEAGETKGEAGGIVRVSTFGRREEYLLTCAHVVTEDCNCCTYKAVLRRESIEQDIVLIWTDTYCFGYARLHEVSPLVDVEQTRERSGLKLLPATKGSGSIFGISQWAAYQQRVHKFPHSLVESDTRIFMDFLRWPPWGAMFGRKGDSGSWVIGSKFSEWIGVLVGGSPDHRLTFVAESGSLAVYLQGVLKAGKMDVSYFVRER